MSFGNPQVVSSAGSSLQPNAPGPVPSPATSVRTAAGIAKVNGTGQLFGSAQAPNDGQVHAFIINYEKVVTINEAGGSCTVTYTLNGIARNINIDGGGTTVGVVLNVQGFFADPGTPITCQQFSALTAGASQVFCAIQMLS